MAARRKNDASVISLDTFGSAKNYWLCWVKSPLTHFSFANQASRQLKRPISYIGGIKLEDIHPDLSFPMYYTCFNQDFDINLVILANHVTAPMDLSLDQQNPLLGGLLFEDDYYLFNNQGLVKIPFSYPQADFVLLLSADKEADMEDYVELLPKLADNRILCQNTPQLIAQSQKKSRQVLDFIQYIYYESEAAIKNYRRQKLFQKLHQKMSVAEANYGKLKFPMENNRVITSSLLRREDF